MEFPELGHQCSSLGCKQLDFLPILCECRNAFCKQHFLDHALSCGKITKLKVVPATSNSPSFKCCHKGCKLVTLHHFPCSKCSEHFCINHRYHSQCDPSEEELAKEKERWNAPKDQFDRAKELVDQQIASNIEKAKLSASKTKNATARKIQLMRLKGKASGVKTIPVTDRVYCLVYPPISKEAKEIITEPAVALLNVESYKTNTFPIFISKSWTLGKVIDNISEHCKVLHSNYKPNSDRLRLFRLSDGVVLSNDMSMSLAELFRSEIVSDGESVILEYISYDHSRLEQLWLKNYTAYIG